MAYYSEYYVNQCGGGRIRVFTGTPGQKGHGIGSFLGGIFRTVLPLIRSGAKAAGREVARTGLNVLSDMATLRMPMKESIKTRMRESTSNLKRAADEQIEKIMSGSGYKKRKTAIQTQSRLRRSRRKIVKKGRKTLSRKTGKKKRRPVVRPKKKPGKRTVEDIFSRT